MTDYRFEREARTPYSEVYTIDDGDNSLGRVDIHYTASATYATLSVHTSLDEDGVQALIAAIDERIVTTADPYREDFIVTVWRGEEFGVFADETDDEDDEMGEEDEDDR
jgi:hypothetical protein